MADSAGATAPTAPSSKKSTVADWSKSKLLRTLRLFNMCNGMGLITVGILIFIVQALSVTFTSVVVSAFVVFFGLLMTCLECNVGSMGPRLKANFGFMFSFGGRTLFILFCSTILFATEHWLGYLVGSITFLNAGFNGYVVCVHPAFRTGELSASSDPFGGYTGGEQEMLAYLKSNPELAKKAGSAAVKVAQQNPELAMQVAAGAHGGGAAGANPWGK